MGSWFWKLGVKASPRLRLVCFPYAGAGAAVYRTWEKRLPPDVELLAAQLPGRGPRISEPPIARLSPLLDALQAALSGHGGAPFAFFGHSMGALTAFELCRRLRRSGGPMPTHLFLSGREPPQHAKVSTPVTTMSDEALIAKLRRYGGTPQEVLQEPELLELVLPSIRADFEVLDTWRHVPDDPLDVPLTVLGGREDAIVRAHVLDGWRDHAQGPFSLHLFAGGHFFLHTGEAAVLDLVGRTLAATG